ncbi:MAG TPA: indolepyruvate ferredoxin oxidoreductase subunit alpha [Candidatus Lokiarchaeia archaeon]|nr:indolepyruvate ferredoxin oxidoreductase subunit alpha [Candidatus Lokiarchaeia archaeon]
MACIIDMRFSPEVGKGNRFLFLGNEALVRGCLEAGVGFIAQYPGTPTSDIGETFKDILEQQPALSESIVHHWSANEAVATSSCAGAAWAGIRALNPMKHVGMNVASDALHAITLAGPNPGALVLVVGSDPGSLGSHHEQNERFFTWMHHVPMIEPHSPQECHDWIKLAFDLSEKYDLPIYFRTSTRSAHSRGIVDIDDIAVAPKSKGEFFRSTDKYCSLPPYAINNHVRLYERIERVTNDVPTFGLNTLYPGDAKIGIISYGIPFGYAMEALHQLGMDDVPVLKLGMTHPLNDDEIVTFIKDLDQVVIVEELEPFLQVNVREIAQKNRIIIPIIGGDAFPKFNEFSTGLVASVLAGITGKQPSPRIQESKDQFDSFKAKIPSRFPTFCPGCPERAMLMAIKKATNDLANPKTIIAGDIGCYVMGLNPPLRISDFIICMSGGLSAAIGLSKKTYDKIIALIGDSTLLHTGLPVIVDAIANDANVLLVVFDNRWVAMTGHQPPVGKGRIQFEPLIQSMGVQWIKTVDPFEVDKTVRVIQDGLNRDGLKVILCQRECTLMARRVYDAERRKLKADKTPYACDTFQVYNCVLCEHCTQELSCPAMRRMIDEETGCTVMAIDEDRCNFCSVCYQICPHRRIKKTAINPHLETKLKLRRIEPQ